MKKTVGDTRRSAYREPLWSLAGHQRFDNVQTINAGEVRQVL